MLRIASACSSREAFIALFGRYCDGEVIFVATRQPRPAGEELSFTITLAGGEALISATGRVMESYREGEGPHGRPGMVIRFRALAPESRMLVAELAAVPGPVGGFPRGTSPPGVVSPLGVDTIDESEPEETHPTGLPRAMVGGRASISSAPGASRGAALGVKPDATPAPVLLHQRSRTGRQPSFTRSRAPGEGHEDGPTGVKAMDEIARSRVRFSPVESGAEFEAGGWEANTEEVFDPSGQSSGRMALRADSMGRLEPGSVEALADCDLHEDSSAIDEQGVPTSQPIPIPRQHDVWDGDETLPPWLRGPVEQPDVPTGSIEIGALGSAEDDPDYPEPRPGDRPGEAALPLPPSLSGALAGVRPGTARPGSHGSALSLAQGREQRAPGTPPFGSSPDLAREPSGNFSSHELAARAPSGSYSSSHDLLAAVDLRPRRRWPVAILGGVLGAILGLAVGYAMGAEGMLDEILEPGGHAVEPGAAATHAAAPSSAPSQPAAVRDAPPVAPAAGVPAAARPPAGAAADRPAASPAPAAEAVAGEVAPVTGRAARLPRGRALAATACGAELETEPSGSAIAVAGKSLGETPARLELPCGTVDVELRRSRYQTAVRRLQLRPGKLERVELRLDRPDHRLRIVSAPLGAAVTVNGRAAGVTPTTASVRGFQHVRVRVDLPGFESWSRRVYAREPMTKVNVKLSPDRGAAAPSPSGLAPIPPIAAPDPGATGSPSGSR